MLKNSLVGIIGQSIQYSLSPIIHEYWMKKYKIKGKYKIFDLNEKELKPFLQTAVKLNLKGLNVTIPYKNKIIDLIDDISIEAKIMGAVNTLVIKENGKIFGHNTDTKGFLNNLENHFPSWKKNNDPIVLIGAGGASRAIIYTLLKHCNSELRILNRNKNRAKNLILDMKKMYPKSIINFYEDHNTALKNSSFLINTSSLGMTGHPELNISLEKMNNNSLIYDIVYSPLETRLLRNARILNFKTLDGLGMLLEQAAPSFNMWFDKNVEVTKELKNMVIKFIKEKK